MTVEDLLKLTNSQLDILVKKAQGSKIEWCKDSPEYGRGEYGENEGYYFFLRGDSNASNHTPYDSEEKAWDCWGPSDSMDLLDEMALGAADYTDIVYTARSDKGSTVVCVDECAIEITGKPREALPRAITIAYILWKQD